MTVRASLFVLLVSCAPAPCPKTPASVGTVSIRTVAVRPVPGRTTVPVALPCDASTNPCTVLARTDQLVARGGPEVALLHDDAAGEHRYTVALSFAPERWRSVALFNVTDHEGSGGAEVHEVRLRSVEPGVRGHTFVLRIDVDQRSYTKGGTGAADDHRYPERFSRAGQTQTVLVDFSDGAPRILLSVPTVLRVYQDQKDEFPDHELPVKVAQVEVLETEHDVRIGPARGPWPRELADVLGTHDVTKSPVVRGHGPIEPP